MRSIAYGAYWNGFLEKNTRFSEFIKKAYPRIFQYINESIKSKRCPVCGRRFSTIYATYRHIKHSDCYPVLLTVIRLIRRHLPEEEVLRRMQDLGIDMAEEVVV